MTTTITTSHGWAFWAAFILTRPLGAVVGDFLDKPHAAGVLFAFPHRAARKAH